jgi:hypothetical protein
MNTSAKQWFKTMAAAAALLAFCALAGTASAATPIKFSVTGTPNSTMYGYTNGQSYTFHWIVNSGFTNNWSSFFDSIDNYWSDELVSEAPIFIDVSGDGLTGSWQRPEAVDNDPYSYLETWTHTGGDTNLELYVGNDGNPKYSIGLQANGTDLYSIYADNLNIGNIFNFPTSYTDPNDYFAGLTGTYTPINGAMGLYPVSGTPLFFNATSVTISAIPEPTTALLTGLGLVALVFLRRRHAR